MIRRSVVVAMLTALGLALIGGQAQAHSQLDSSVPAAGATVDTAPTLIELTFNQEIGTEFANVGLTDSSGAGWVAQISEVEGKTVRVAVSPSMPPQQYTVAYRVVSDDGHPITGSYEFTYAAPAAAPTEAQQNSPTAPTTVAAGEPAATSSSSSGLPWLLIGVMVVLVLGGVAVTLRASKRSKR